MQCGTVIPFLYFSGGSLENHVLFLFSPRLCVCATGLVVAAVRPEIRIQEGEIILPPGVQLPPGVDPEDLNQMTDEEISRMIMDYQEGRIDMEEALQRQKERQMQKLQERMDRQRRKREEKHQRELDDAARELAQEEAREQKELEDR